MEDEWGDLWRTEKDSCSALNPSGRKSGIGELSGPAPDRLVCVGIEVFRCRALNRGACFVVLRRGGGAFEDRPGLDPQKGGQAACSLLEPGLDKGTFITLQAALSYCGTPPFHGTQGSGLHPVIAIKF